MSLIQQLDEASTIPIEQLKDKMKKDPRVKVLFTRDPQLDQVKDVPEFIKTLRYYVFSNPSVRQHIEKRADRRDISKSWWQRMAGMKPDYALSDIELGWLASFMKELFKDVGYTAKKDMSKRAADALQSAVDGDRMHLLDTYAQKEINSLNIKPDGPITVYRGFGFSGDDLQIKGTGVGEGLRFIQSIRKGTRTVDLTTDKATLWTTSKEDALHYALFGKGSEWREKSKTGQVEGYNRLLAFVVSTLATPDDMIVQLSELSKVTGWPGSNSKRYHGVILHPGKFLVKVISKHDKTGEINAVDTSGDEELSGIRESLSFLGKILKLPVPDITFEGFGRFTHSPETMAEMGLLLNDETISRLDKLFGTVVRYYQKNLKHIDAKALAAQAGDEPAAFKALTELHEIFYRTIRHKTLADPESRDRAQRTAGYARIKDLTDPTLAVTAKSTHSELTTMAHVVAAQKRFTDWRSVSPFVGLAKIADPNYKAPDKLHLAAWSVQKQLVDRGVDGFFKVVGEPKPDTPSEQAARILELGEKATAVSWVARFLIDVKNAANMVNEK